jgi:hypothetical protein
MNPNHGIAAYDRDKDISHEELLTRLANLKNHGVAAYDWDKDISDEELLTRLANLKRRTGQSYPILDDDDLEAAIEEAADRLAAD